MTDEQGGRNPEEAAQDIREKIQSGDEPSGEEIEFMEGENLELESDRPERRSSKLTG